MRFSLLGPLVVADGTENPLTPSGPRLRVLLAALLLHANVPVPAGALAEMVWDGSPPPAAADTLRSYIKRLRQALGHDATRIMARGAGYQIRVAQTELDVLEFQALCRDAHAALRVGEWQDASATAGQALRLWRGAPLLDVPAEALRGTFVPQLEWLRLQALEDGFDAGIRLGRYQGLIPQLQDAAVQHPLQERFHVQLMIALASTGRRAQALRAYQGARRVLVDELGIEPGPELRDLHRKILVGEVPGAGERDSYIPPGEGRATTVTGTPSDLPDVQAEDTASAEPAGPAVPRPAQLPADIADFTGRAVEVDQVCRMLTRRDVASGPGTVRIAVVAGAAGLGKTALAVHAAHLLQHVFPDGQLYMDLSGAGTEPAVPGEVLARFLRDLGVDAGSVPAVDEERAALYRTQLADRRMLILLDNVKDTAQVRPLIPGSAACAVLMTTRSRTPYLLSTRFINLDTLSEGEAAELFSRIVGEDRSAAEPAATAEILSACAGLPLAIRICAARLATRGHWQIATMASRLRDERRRLDELQFGDLEVRASFQVSYGCLGMGRHKADPARTFRLLGLWQGHQIGLPAAAALADGKEEDVAIALETLVDSNLLESSTPDRYQFHDLMRLFATERAQEEEPQVERHEAVARLLRWYLVRVEAAATVISPYRYRPPLSEPQVASPPPGSPEAALAWYDSELANMITAIRQASAAGLHDIAWQLPTALFPLFNRRANWNDCIGAHRIAVDSARTAGSRQAEAWALHNLGHALARSGDTEAFARLEEALAVRRESGDHEGESQTLVSLTDAHYQMHGPGAAVDHSMRSLDVLRQVGNPATLQAALTNHGEFCLELGKLDEAANCLHEALGIQGVSGEYVRGHALQNLGCVYLEMGLPHEAITSLTEAHRLLVEAGDLRAQAVTLRHLGQAQRDSGHEDQARESLTTALVLFQELEAEAEVKAVLAALARLARLVSPA